MPNKPPVAIVLFSNDLDDFLPSVEQERKLIEEALEHYSDTNRLKVVARSSVSIEEIFRLFNRYQGRIALFHFAGHAGGEGLQLNKNFAENVTGFAGGLADLFKREVEDGILQLVFLNGCSTEPQLEGLKAAGVPSVISTSVPIDDEKALNFANQFYRSLASADQTDPFDNPSTVEQAFDQALAYLKTIGAVDEEQSRASGRFQLIDPTKSTEEAWTWHSTNGTWTLSAEVAEEHKVFNEYLTRQLIEALPDYSKPARRFLSKAQHIPDWESVTRVSDKAKDILAYSFVGVLGIQLRKLFAIGKEPNSEDKQSRYLAHTILTGKRALKLISFALLSSLWDQQREQSLSLTQAQQAHLQAFFDDEFGFDLYNYFHLLCVLTEIFQSQQLQFPISELEVVLSQFKPESELEHTCIRLKELTQKLDKVQFNLADCFAAERQLTYLLKKLAFLAKYRMVSIKNITYNELRNAPPRYLHSYTILGIDSKRNINSERVNYVDAPISTQAILLFKGRYQHSINLFPFIIDLNALTYEPGSKVCFYSHQDINDNSLNYQFMEDNSLVNIAFQNISQEESEINELMMNEEKRRAYNLDSVFLQFQAAKKSLLQLEEDPLFEEDNDDFDF